MTRKPSNPSTMCKISLTSWAIVFSALGLLAGAGVDRPHTDGPVSPSITHPEPRMTADPESRGPWWREFADGALACSIEEESEDDERGDDGHATPVTAGGRGASRPAQSALSRWHSTLGAPPNPGRALVLRC